MAAGKARTMPFSVTPSRLLLVSACFPLALTACSSSHVNQPATRTPQSATTTSNSPSPVPSATLPVATAYVVTATKGVSDKDLTDAIAVLAKLKGVTSVSRSGPHQLRVDLGLDELPNHGAELLADLRKLGSISVPE